MVGKIEIDEQFYCEDDHNWANRHKIQNEKMTNGQQLPNVTKHHGNNTRSLSLSFPESSKF